MTEIRLVGATIWLPGSVIEVVGVCCGARGFVSYGRVDVPLRVGAAGGRLSKVARKLARSRALKKIARDALKLAARAGGGEQSRVALSIAQRSFDKSKTLERQALSVPDSQIPDEEGL